MGVKDFLHPISKERLRGAYWIDTSQMGAQLRQVDNTLTRLRLRLLENTPDGNRLTYLVAFFTRSSEPILEQDISRWLCDNKALLGRPGYRSKVAVRVGFFVRPAFRGAGLAVYLLAREENVFRKWGAAEIQVLAMCLGRWVWTRPRFAYSMDTFDFQTLQERYKEWQRAGGATSIVQAPDLSAFPRDFLLSAVNSLTLYKTL